MRKIVNFTIVKLFTKTIIFHVKNVRWHLYVIFAQKLLHEKYVIKCTLILDSKHVFLYVIFAQIRLHEKIILKCRMSLVAKLAFFM